MACRRRQFGLQEAGWSAALSTHACKHLLYMVTDACIGMPCLHALGPERLSTTCVAVMLQSVCFMLLTSACVLPLSVLSLAGRVEQEQLQCSKYSMSFLHSPTAAVAFCNRPNKFCLTSFKPAAARDKLLLTAASQPPQPDQQRSCHARHTPAFLCTCCCSAVRQRPHNCQDWICIIRCLPHSCRLGPLTAHPRGHSSYVC